MVLDSPPEDRISRESEFRANITCKLNDSKTQFLKLPRSQTLQVISRWYRAPEIITLQKNYNQAADVWSIGCVLLEIILVFLKKP